MGYGHEAGEGWSSENCVVLRLPVDHLEIKCFLAEIGRAPEYYLQAYPSHGVDYFAWYDPWNVVPEGLRALLWTNMSSSVWVNMMLIPLPPSMNTRDMS